MPIVLNPNPEPNWVELPNGAALFCDPPTSFVSFAARAEADRLVADLITSGEIVTKVGGRIVGLPDLTDAEAVKGLHMGLFAVSLAELAATDWRGVQSADGNPVVFNSSLLALLFEQPGVPEAFLDGYMKPLHEVVAEGNV